MTLCRALSAAAQPRALTARTWQTGGIGMETSLNCCGLAEQRPLVQAWHQLAIAYAPTASLLFARKGNKIGERSSVHGTRRRQV